MCAIRCSASKIFVFAGMLLNEMFFWPWAPSSVTQAARPPLLVLPLFLFLFPLVLLFILLLFLILTQLHFRFQVHESLRTDNYGEPWGPGDVVGFLVKLKSPSPEEIR